MTLSFPATLTRRRFLATVGAAAAGTAFGVPLLSRAQSAAAHEILLRPAAGQAQLVAEPHSPTPVWCYNDQVPGPEIRVRQGDRLRIAVENGLGEATSVHWHGLRLPNAMDGVPHLTQAPIPPGGRFLYEFDAVDAGTFWYHPHLNSSEQVGRGLYGALIVEEAEPPRVDRDLVWILDDWRLDDEARIVDDFGNLHDMSHGGRLGNVATINDRPPQPLQVRSGERIRLRLINTANARILALAFDGHAPQVIALDGQPVAPHAPDEGLVVLGPGMRADLILDMTGRPGERFAVAERSNPRRSFRLTEFAYGEAQLRDAPADWPVALPANPLPEPDPADVDRHEVVFNGGMMGGMGARRMGGTMPGMAMMREGKIWLVNGRAGDSEATSPLLSLQRGRSQVVTLVNANAFPHPVHLHGHAFRTLSRNGAPNARAEWRDTVLLSPMERVEIAFVADNPGDWMLHCHILEHQMAGMMAVIRIA